MQLYFVGDFPKYFRLCHVFKQFIIYWRGPGSSVGVATDYELDGPGSNLGGEEIFTPLQTGPGAHPASCKMGNGSFPGVEAAGAWGWSPPTPI